MCGRYAVTKDPATLAIEFAAADATAGEVAGDHYNIAPSQHVAAVVARHPRDPAGNTLTDEPATRSLRAMRWGLVPFWAKDPTVGNRMINTRAETASEKPAFRNALTRRRCLIPADGWFEWRAKPAGEAVGTGKKSGKDPYFMTPRDGSSLALAGLWETWRDPNGESDAAPLVTCSVLTTDAIGRLADIHHRMPLLMPTDAWSEWLDPDNTDARHLLHEPSEALVDSLELRPVSTRVNSVRNNGPELIERVDAAPTESNALFGLPET